MKDFNLSRYGKIISLTNPTSEYISKRTGIRISKRYQHSYIYCSITINNQNAKTIQGPINDEQMHKMLYIPIIEQC